MTLSKVVRKGSYQGVAQWGINTSAEITPSRATARKWAELENAQAYRTITTFTECTWPFDSTAAKTIRCLVVKAPMRAKLYVWKSATNRYWQWTMSAGANSERSMTGCVPIAPSLLDDQGAVDASVADCKRYRVWDN